MLQSPTLNLPFVRPPAAIALAALVGFNLYLVTALRPYFLPIDDAYITLHNARVLWTGVDPNYGVSALVGATSPVHLAMVALLYPLLGAGAAIAVSFVGAALYLLGVDRLARQLDLPLVPTSILTLTALGSGYAVYQLVNGLETSLVLAAVTWAIVLAQDRRSRALPLLCGALPFLRPELAILSAALMARQLHVRWQDKALRPGMTDIALAAASALPWILWTWAQTGSVLPNTAGAKLAFFAQVHMRVGTKVVWVWGAICAGLGLVGVAPLLVRPSSLAAALWAYSALFLILFGASFPGGLSLNFERYTFALLPVALWALGELWRSRRAAFGALAAPLALITPVFIFIGAATVVGSQPALSEAFEAAAWVKAHVPAGQTVLIHDAGVISWASDARLADLVGLKTPSAAAVHQKLTLPSSGARRAEAIDDIARRADARWAVILDDGGFWAAIGKDLATRHWRLALVRAPGLPHGYAVYRLTPPT